MLDATFGDFHQVFLCPSPKIMTRWPFRDFSFRGWSETFPLLESINGENYFLSTWTWTWRSEKFFSNKMINQEWRWNLIFTKSNLRRCRAPIRGRCSWCVIVFCICLFVYLCLFYNHIVFSPCRSDVSIINISMSASFRTISLGKNRLRKRYNIIIINQI